MTAPAPILWFERLFLAALAIRMAVSVVNWERADAPSVQIGIIVALLLWFGVKYRHSRIAALLVAVLFALVALATWRQVSAFGLTWLSASFVLVLALHAAAIACLLHPGARAWFATRPD